MKRMIETKRENIEWCDVWISGGDRSDTKRILLVGDSIARSYYPHVQQGVGDSFSCARLCTSKCVCDPSFEREMSLVLDDFEYAAIHFNNGLHGWKYTNKEYFAGLEDAFELLKNRFPRSALIWASTTPVRRPEAPAELDPLTEKVIERNQIAADLCFRYGAPINDLFSLVLDHPECFAEDGVHFNDQGRRVMGAETARKILAEYFE